MNELESVATPSSHDNPFLEDLARFMEHPISRSFYEKYLMMKSVRRETFLFMFLYAQLEWKKPHLSPFQKTAMIQRLMRNREIRRRICEKWTQMRSVCI